MEKLEGIKNIIFDLGNVLIPLQVKKAGEVFNSLMNQSLSTDQFIEKNYDAFRQYETGKISTRAFVGAIRQHMRPEVTDDQIKEAWNMVLGDFPGHYVEMLSRLKDHYQLYILSNTNELHAQFFETRVPGVAHLGDLFDGLHYSHVEGLRKPQPELYEKILRDNNLVPQETLFADDLEENLEAAARQGIQTLLVTPDLDLYKWFLG